MESCANIPEASADGFAVQFAGSIYAPNGTASPYKFTQPGYAAVGLMAQYRFDPSWTVTLYANNVVDKVFYERVGGAVGGNWHGMPQICDHPRSIHPFLAPPARIT
ncbi:TonB-dependent receptor [Achromobacter sp. UMC46]|uniref:TonB-dependent receptor n=1 Tax=Achromobacter sp. UMC46 TaxID=1862319 RepID=UPI00160280A2|nr:TonB-dependent receptor [Achromobacter sp. UMC46]MBB1597515.1 hypothetical protein [Achromobacter sp. UMC46]